MRGKPHNKGKEVSLTQTNPKSVDIMPMAGRLQHFSTNWEEITQDSEILQTINGCIIEFVDGVIPKQSHFRTYNQFNENDLYISLMWKLSLCLRNMCSR